MVLDGSDIYHMMSKVYVVGVVSFANCNSCNLLPISSGVGSSVFFRYAVVSRCWEEVQIFLFSSAHEGEF